MKIQRNLLDTLPSRDHLRPDKNDLPDNMRNKIEGLHKVIDTLVEYLEWAEECYGKLVSRYNDSLKDKCIKDMGESSYRRRIKDLLAEIDANEITINMLIEQRNALGDYIRNNPGISFILPAIEDKNIL